MTTRMSLTEFTDAINRESGSLLRLFAYTPIDPHQVPQEIYHLCVAANLQFEVFNATLDRIAEVLGYEREEI
jgi:hypothetical protein